MNSDFDKNSIDPAVLARETALQMSERLSLVSLKPKRILEVSLRFGENTPLLKKRYPDAEIVSSDYLIDTLPFDDNSIDLIFANLVLPWCKNNEKVLREWQRVLRPEGLLMFTSLGPDTLREIQQRSEVLRPQLIEMHNAGDKLAEIGFADPVLDIEYFTLVYRDFQTLLAELRAAQMISLEAISLSIEKNKEGAFALTYEVVYAHAWGSETRTSYSADEAGVVKIPLDALRRR